MMNQKKCIFFVIVGILVILTYAAGLISASCLMLVQLLLLVALMAIDFRVKRTISLFQIWIFAFIYIIWSDMVLSSVHTIDGLHNKTYIFLFLANSTVLLSYLTFSVNKTPSYSQFIYTLKRPRLFFATIILLAILFLSSSISSVTENLSHGRQMGATLGNGSVIGLVKNVAGLLLPSLIAYYFCYIKKDNRWWHLFISAPFFCIQFVLGTRYKLLYQIIPYLIIIKVIDLNYQSFKKLFILLCVAIVLSVSSGFLKKNRYKSLFLSEMSDYSFFKSSKSNATFCETLAHQMSPEGIVSQTERLKFYFEKHSHSWGKEITFMFYFWIPRSLWKSKPVPIDYWVIREYEIVDESYSTASGFTGEIFADFGNWCYVILCVFGCVLKKCENFIKQSFSAGFNNFNSILSTLIFPCVFFFVRSPLTAMECFFMELGVLVLIRFVCFEKIKKY